MLNQRKSKKETHAKYEERIWREKCHTNGDGVIVIPGIAFKRSIETAARFLSVKIPGKGNATYTKHFKAGILVTDSLSIKVKKKDVECEKVFMDIGGKKGSAAMLSFPIVREWCGFLSYYIIDDTIGKEIFEQHLREAGDFIGVGRWRPENGGLFGRYSVEKIKWVK